MPYTIDKLDEVVHDKGMDYRAYSMHSDYIAGRYNINMLDHNAVCYHFAHHPKYREFIFVDRHTGDLIYKGYINNTMLRALKRDRVT
jgi:hypothetical protein